MKNLLSSLSVAIFLLIAPVAALAQFNPVGQACTGNGSQSAVCQEKGNNDPIAGKNGIISKAANIIAMIAGVGAVIMIILGGFYYVTSGGNADAAAKAKSRIISGFIGVVIVALAWALVRFVIDKVIR